MEIIELRSDPSLGYGSTKVEGNLDLSFLDNPSEVMLFTPCMLKDYKKKEILLINGTTRCLREIKADIVLYNVKSTSPFYANIFWDLSHSISIGKKIYVYEEIDNSCILDSDYFNSAFTKVRIDSTTTVYEKKELLICEKSAGLESWTFGIPVGPEDPVFLNYTVKRILELGIEDFEIILCGKPHANFKYFDKVSIVGEEIPAPPVHITKKKNTIARSATKNNLCIIHDRVLLPLNFKEAIDKFGDYFPLVGFQSYYFSDYLNLIPRKYSDFNTLNNKLTKHLDVNKFDKNSIKLVAHNFNFYYQNPMRSSFGKDYLTGSLYICKTNLWRYCPQNENLYWDDFEDVEYGSRTAILGIPSIINPYSITQSMNARSLLHYYGYIYTISKKGKVKLSRSITEALCFGKKKPLFRITEKDAIRRMLSFAHKYANDEDVIRSITSSKLTGRGRIKAIIKIVNNLQVPIWKMRDFVKDVNRDILFESMPPEQQKDMLEYLTSNVSPQEKKNFIVNLPILHNQTSNSLNNSLFFKTANDWYVKNTTIMNLGCWISAFNIKYLSGCSYFPISLRELKNIIHNTTMLEISEK
ncbi:MAG TPA: hypothetical protein DEO73_08610 [Pantoea sp.]|nr:hypothetical protein [Pantoea sp.]